MIRKKRINGYSWFEEKLLFFTRKAIREQNTKIEIRKELFNCVEKHHYPMWPSRLTLSRAQYQ
jgi:hypothetical protein